jgi:membrane associated rhomboid family serine protease
MDNTGIATFVLIAANFLFSYNGFKDPVFYEKNTFEIDKILIEKDYKRLITSGFLHVNWLHLIFNMASLYIFSDMLEAHLGFFNFLIIYFASLIGGSLLSLWLHRHHGDYSAVGASGAVCGVIFAAIALFPDLRVGFFFLPTMPSWAYCLLFVAASLYGIRSQASNIGHDAHLGGALIGLVVAIIMHPEALAENWLVIALVFIPSVIFIFLTVRKPHLLLVNSIIAPISSKFETIDDKFNAKRAANEQEIDRILEKIHKRGMDSLNKTEQDILKNSKK